MRYAHRRGFFVADALIAVAVALALAGVVAGVLRWDGRARDGLADSRAATAAAEAALADLDQSTEPAGCRVEPLPDGALVPGHHWARVTATVNGRRASLVGLVPDQTGGGR